MYTLFLDESGDHDLQSIQPDYPIFILGGVISSDDDVRQKINPGVQRFKEKLFGTDQVILHTADITRNRKGFEQLKDKSQRERFYKELNQLMSDLPYSVICCIIDKSRHRSRYGDGALDPYILSLHILVERLFMEVQSHGTGGTIVAESRNTYLDTQLDLAWQEIMTKGTEFVSATEIRSRVRGLAIRPKSDNIPGLQLADLVLSNRAPLSG